LGSQQNTSVLSRCTLSQWQKTRLLREHSQGYFEGEAAIHEHRGIIALIGAVRALAHVTIYLIWQERKPHGYRNQTGSFNDTVIILTSKRPNIFRCQAGRKRMDENDGLFTIETGKVAGTKGSAIASAKLES